MRRSRYILAVLAVALGASGCTPPAHEAAPPPAAPPKAEPEHAAPEVAPAPNAPEFVVEPAWPAGWKETLRGQAGPEALPLVWFELDAGTTAPDVAVRAALLALKPLTGALTLDDRASSQGTPHVIAQFRGERLAGVIDARPSGATTVVRVTVEPSH